MRILTFASTKGGVGKTTMAALIADSFLRSGATVRVVDFDSQISLTKWAEPITQRTSNLKLSAFNLDQEAKFADFYNAMIEEFEDETDWVIIDTKGTDDSKQFAALAICDLVLSPSGPVADEVTGIEKTLRYLKKALELTGDADADPKEYLRVLYHGPGGFLDAEGRAYRELIFDHYGAIEGMHRAASVAGFIGRQMTTDEIISAASENNLDPKPFRKVQVEADRITKLIEGEFNG